MNYLIYVLSWIGFLVLPGLLLSIRLLYEKIMPWWLLTLLVLILSWVLTNSGVHFYYEYLSDLIESTPDPSRELMDEFGADGAKLVFALFFWLVIWLCLLVAVVADLSDFKTSTTKMECLDRTNHEEKKSLS